MAIYSLAPKHYGNDDRRRAMDRRAAATNRPAVMEVSINFGAATASDLRVWLASICRNADIASIGSGRRSRRSCGRYRMRCSVVSCANRANLSLTGVLRFQQPLDRGLSGHSCAAGVGGINQLDCVEPATNSASTNVHFVVDE